MEDQSKQQKQGRLHWWNPKTQSDTIAEFKDGEWAVYEKEWGSVRWFPVPLTAELHEQIREVLRNSGEGPK